MTDYRERTAYHEASHAVVAVRLGVPLGVVSIRPTRRYGGVCGAGGAHRIHSLEPALPLVLQYARPRRHLETHIRFLLAGPLADHMWFPSSGYQRTPKIIRPADRPNLPPVAAAQLAAFEAAGNGPGEPVHDEDAALTEADLLVGPTLAGAYIAWARADVAEMVDDNAFAIERVAHDLLAHDALSPHAVRAAMRRIP
jgi:hypothetical protein